jgi:protein ImuB
MQRLCVVRPELKGRPIVLFEESSRGGLQVAHARCDDVFRGMPLAEARALAPQAQVEPYVPTDDRDCLESLAVECQRFGPIVGTDGVEALFLDVTGCAPHFGGEAALIREVARFMLRHGFAVRVAIADTVGAAWAVGRYGRGGIVESVENALAPLPVAALRLENGIVATLFELGVRTVGQLRSLPRKSLPSRFGGIVARRLDQAFGDVPELITPLHDRAPIEVEWAFDEPVADRRSLEMALYQLLEQLTDALQRRQLGVQRLTCRLDDLTFVIGTTSPTTSVSHLWELVRLHLERLALPAEVVRVTIEATMTARRREEQRQIIPDERGDERELRRLLDRMGSRLGEGALLRPRLLPDPLPERACGYVPVFEDAPPNSVTNPAGLFRPLWIAPQPIPVEVTSVYPDGPPRHFRWKGEEHSIEHAWGPERITTGWWRASQVRRDYYRVETTTGGRFWLFRTEGTWFLQGVFE